MNFLHAWFFKFMSFIQKYLCLSFTILNLLILQNSLLYLSNCTSVDTGSLTGVVTDEDGNNLADIEISLGSYNQTTNSLGRFLFDDIRVGRIVLIIDNENYEQFQKIVSILKGDNTYNIELTSVTSTDDGGIDDDGEDTGTDTDTGAETGGGTAPIDTGSVTLATCTYESENTSLGADGLLFFVTIENGKSSSFTIPTSITWTISIEKNAVITALGDEVELIADASNPTIISASESETLIYSVDISQLTEALTGTLFVEPTIEGVSNTSADIDTINIQTPASLSAMLSISDATLTIEDEFILTLAVTNSGEAIANITNILPAISGIDDSRLTLMGQTTGLSEGGTLAGETTKTNTYTYKADEGSTGSGIISYNIDATEGNLGTSVDTASDSENILIKDIIELVINSANVDELNLYAGQTFHITLTIENTSLTDAESIGISYDYGDLEGIVICDEASLAGLDADSADDYEIECSTTETISSEISGSISITLIWSDEDTGDEWESETPESTESISVEYIFTDISDEEGDAGYTLSENVGYANDAKFVNIDGDDDLEVFVVNGYTYSENDKNKNILYDLIDGHYNEVSAAHGLDDDEVYSNVIAAADYDADGDVDIFVGSGGGAASRLHQNDGDGNYTKVNEAVFASHKVDVKGADFSDIDQDGDLDLLMCAQSSRVRLLINTGGEYTESAVAHGLSSSTIYANRCHFTDVDNDSYPDILIARGTPSSYSTIQYYQNDGDGTFTDRTTASGLSVTGNFMDIAFIDYDIDGDLDLYAANGVEDGETTDCFYKNNAGTFVLQDSEEIGIGNTSYSTQADAIDVNRDGYPDLYVSVAGSDGSDLLYINDKDGTFTESAEGFGIMESSRSFASAWGDYDADGKLDLLIAKTSASSDGEACSLYKNNSENGNSYATIKIVSEYFDGDGDVLDTNLETEDTTDNDNNPIAKMYVDLDGNADFLSSGDLLRYSFIGNSTGYGLPSDTKYLTIPEASVGIADVKVEFKDESIIVQENIDSAETINDIYNFILKTHEDDGLASNNITALSYADADTLVVGTDAGLNISADAGETFEDTSITNEVISIDVKDADHFAAATSDGLYLTTDGGTSFTQFAEGISCDACLSSSATDFAYGATSDIFAIAFDNGGGVVLTADGGETFNQIGGEYLLTEAVAVDIYDNDADKIVIGTKSQAGSLAGIWVSEDGGTVFENILAGTEIERSVLSVKKLKYYNNANEGSVIIAVIDSTLGATRDMALYIKKTGNSQYNFCKINKDDGAGYLPSNNITTFALYEGDTTDTILRNVMFGTSDEGISIPKLVKNRYAPTSEMDIEACDFMDTDSSDDSKYYVAYDFENVTDEESETDSSRNLPSQNITALAWYSGDSTHNTYMVGTDNGLTLTRNGGFERRIEEPGTAAMILTLASEDDISNVSEGQTIDLIATVINIGGIDIENVSADFMMFAYEDDLSDDLVTFDCDESSYDILSGDSQDYGCTATFETGSASTDEAIWMFNAYATNDTIDTNSFDLTITSQTAANLEINEETISISPTNKQITAGQEVEFTVTVANSGKAEAQNLVITASESPLIDDIICVASDPVELIGGESETTTVTCSTEEDITPTDYLFNISVSGLDANSGAEVADLHSLGVENLIAIQSPSNLILTISSLDYDLVAGQNFTLDLNVQNCSGCADATINELDEASIDLGDLATDIDCDESSFTGATATLSGGDSDDYTINCTSNETITGSVSDAVSISISWTDGNGGDRGPASDITPSDLNLDYLFSDTTSDHFSLTESKDSKCAVSLDWDHDEDEDLFICNGKNSDTSDTDNENILYLNSGNSDYDFTDSGLDFGKYYTNSAVAADFDSDGNIDIYEANSYSQPDFIRFGDGEGLIDRTVEQDDTDEEDNNVNSKQACIFDIDHDNDLDIYLAVNDGKDLLLINNGSGTFEKDTLFTPATDYSNGCLVTDYNNDGWQDILVLNGSSAHRKPIKLYENNKDGTLTDVAETAGLDVSNLYSILAADFDFDNDGDLDLYIGINSESDKFYLNNDGSFADNNSNLKDNSGATTSESGDLSGLSIDDFNNDKYLDLYVSRLEGEQDYLYKNMSAESTAYFQEWSAELGISGTEGGSGVCFNDFNQDGNPDLYLANNSANNDILYENLGENELNKYILIEPLTNIYGDANSRNLQSTEDNRLALGAKIEIDTDQDGLSDIFRWMNSGTRSGQSSHYLPIGLGTLEDDALVDVTVTFPDGSIIESSDNPVNTVNSAIAAPIQINDDVGFRSITTTQGLPSNNITAVAFYDDNDPKKFIIGTDTGVAYTTNGGLSFAQITTSEVAVTDIATFDDGDTWLIGTDGYGVIFTNNAGISYTVFCYADIDSDTDGVQCPFDDLDTDLDGDTDDDDTITSVAGIQSNAVSAVGFSKGNDNLHFFIGYRSTDEYGVGGIDYTNDGSTFIDLTGELDDYDIRDIAVHDTLDRGNIRIIIYIRA